MTAVQVKVRPGEVTRRARVPHETSVVAALKVRARLLPIWASAAETTMMVPVGLTTRRPCGPVTGWGEPGEPL